MFSFVLYSLYRVNGQADRRTFGQEYKRTDEQTDKQTDGQMVKQTVERPTYR
jgi:hypothetical protein